MPPRPRLEVERSLEINFARLSPRFGCGLMLKDLPRYDGSDALINIMDNYGYRDLAADQSGARTVANRGLLKTFYDNAFSHKLSLRRNFYQSYHEQDLLLAHDSRIKKAWFVGEPENRMALVNYFRDAVSLGLKAAGVALTGATVRLTPLGWQNLSDGLPDEFLDSHPHIKRVDVMSVLSGVRWREPALTLGVTYLNFQELPRIRTAISAALRGERNQDIQS